ncbi:SCO1/SenC family protein [Paraburkholderia fungorum]|uniref:SCO1/SenC family protein n=1 Tax=Paraburkholderia fungorum TaxID=134537 RepID=A0AAU8TB73_9BURK|nr:SCO family protein [Paraburkholderia fungorum]AJZ60997.1 SCO1/SenC family protein [Paraburkholderia fungorum]MBU7437358.1 SCO family protein [Paraburkholderia fungorum]
MNTRPHSIEHTSGRTLTRRAVLRGMASAALTTMSPRLYAQHVQMGVVNPPVQLDDAWLIDQTGKKQRLNDLLSQHVTALQTIYTGCSSVCPLQGALFTAVQDRLPHIRANHPVQLLSVGIDPLSDSPAALHEWLMRFQAGPAWNAATPTLGDVDRIRTALSGSRLPLGNIADHATQIYCFDASAKLRWRSADLPRADEICDVLNALGRV